jgi:hypothetical protein
MLTAITSIIGFLGGFIPTILKLFQSMEDHKHELAILKVQAEMQAQGHKERLEEIKLSSEVKIAEIEAEADSKESENLYKPMQPIQTGWSVADGILNLYNGTIRPTVTYGFVFFYWIVKYAQYQVLQANNQNTWANIKELYGEFDQSALVLVLSYYFGQRQARWVFGKFYDK